MNRKILIVILTLFIFTALIIFTPFQQGIAILMNGNINELVNWIRSWGIWAPILSIFLMIFQAIAAPLPSFLIAGANGMVFGIGWGALISWSGAMLGAIIPFILSRIFGEAILNQKRNKQKWLNKLDRLSEEHGMLIVLILRLVPVVSFDLVSYAAGLTRMKVSHFLIGTGIGMIPGTVIYTIIGHDLLHLEDFKGRLIVLFILLVTLIVIGVWLRKRLLNEKQ